MLLLEGLVSDQIMNTLLLDVHDVEIAGTRCMESTRKVGAIGTSALCYFQHDKYALRHDHRRPEYDTLGDSP
jgi:hypothetical protein